MPTTPGPAAPADVPADRVEIDEAGWLALLETPEPSPELVRWLIDRTNGYRMCEAGNRAWRATTLLSSAVPLTGDDLSRLVGVDGVPSLVAARAALAHPAATIRTTTDLLDGVMNHWGGPRFERRWGGERQEQLVAALMQEERPAIALPARIRYHGLRPWADGAWNERDLLLRDTVRAHRRYAGAMATIDGYGIRGWAVVAALIDNPHVTGPQYLDAVTGALGEAPVPAGGATTTE